MNQNVIVENDFYQNYYSQIKNRENELLTDIGNLIKNINEQSETKLVEHVLSRIKNPESATEKLKLAGYEPTAENAVGFLSDVIGVRLIVHFIGDIYTIRNILVSSGKFDVVKEKDYVNNAKKTGYRGYHIIVQTDKDGFKIRVEIQLRTIAMDCWASLEHQIRYKKGIKNTELINSELKKCSDDLMSCDIAMEQIWSLIRSSGEVSEEDDEFFSDAMSYTNQVNWS